MSIVERRCVLETGQSSVVSKTKTGCSFAANTAQGISAGVRLQGVALFDSCSFVDHAFTVVFLDSASKSIFSECSFERNVVTNTLMEAPISVSMGSPSVRFESCIFMSNEGHHGGALYVETSSMLPTEISSSKFVNNTAISDGGAIYVDSSSSLVVFDSNFELNEAEYTGGAIVCYQSESCLISSSIFEFNRGLFGSAIYLYSITASSYYESSDGTRRDEESSSSLSSSSSIAIKDCLFNNNTSIGGGSVQIDSSTGVLVENSTFYGTSSFSGSFLLEIESSFNTTIMNSIFGYMKGGGSAIHVASSQWTLFSNCSFSSIHSVLFGGAAVVLKLTSTSTSDKHSYSRIESDIDVREYEEASSSPPSPTTLTASTTFLDCVFANNVASVGVGGAVYLENATASFYNCLFDSNIAGERSNGGGAIFVDSSSSITCNNCTFTDNVADYAFPGGGGAVYLAGLGVFANTLFYQNSANYSADGGGGAVFVSELLQDITFDRNKASAYLRSCDRSYWKKRI